ncbi:MAG: nitroreductase [Mycobacterium sp.]
MINFDQLVRDRSSIRDFLPTPVPRDALMAAVETAQHAPSNSNIQPWRVVIAEGATRQRLSESLVGCVRKNGLARMELPDEYNARRFAVGVQVYGALGVQRGDTEARFEAGLRNFRFFGAPVAAIVGVDSRLGLADIAGVGMYLQTLALALHSQGISSCMQVAPAMFPEAIRPVLDLPESLNLICAVSIGYANPDAPVNSVRAPRDPVSENVTFLG